MFAVSYYFYKQKLKCNCKKKSNRLIKVQIVTVININNHCADWTLKSHLEKSFTKSLVRHITQTVDVVPHCTSGIVSLPGTGNRHAVCRIGAHVVSCWKLPAKLARHVNCKVLLLVVILILQKDSITTSLAIKKRSAFSIKLHLIDRNAGQNVSCSLLPPYPVEKSTW